MLLDVDQRPSAGKGILLSFPARFRHVWCDHLGIIDFGMPVSVALFCFRCWNTHLHAFILVLKIPSLSRFFVRLYHSCVCWLWKKWGDVSAAQTEFLFAGLRLLSLVATSIRFVGTKWIDRLLPLVIIGLWSSLLSLGLAGSAVTNAGLEPDGNWKKCSGSRCYFPNCWLYQYKGKSTLRINSVPLCHYRWLPLRFNSWFGWLTYNPRG